MFRIIGLVGLLVASCHAIADTVIAGMSLDRLQRYEAFVETEIENQRIAGAVSLISRRGEVVYFDAAGQRDIASGQPMATDQIFFIQSMTKPIISTAMMMLYEEGHFFLDDPVAKYLPAFAEWEVLVDPTGPIDGETEPQATPITIKHLLSHTSGMVHGLGQTALDKALQARRQEVFPTVQARLAAIMEYPLLTQPGTRWNYSFSPDVLSVLIEKFSGMSTDAFLQTRIFNPLGMRDTGYNLNDAQAARVADLHSFNKEGVMIVVPEPPQVRRQGNTIWSGVNGLWSTAEDYLRFAQMLLNGGELDGARLLSPKTVDLMTRNHVGNLFPPGTGFGLGVGVVTDIADNAMLGSEGVFWWGGLYSTQFFVDPAEDMVAILMVQVFPFLPQYREKLRVLVTQAIVD